MFDHSESRNHLRSIQRRRRAAPPPDPHFLAADERDVSEIVIAVGSISVGLEAPRRAAPCGLVRVRRNGRHRLYRTNAERSSHARVDRDLRALLRHQLNRVKERAEAHVNSGLASQQPGSTNPKFPRRMYDHSHRTRPRISHLQNRARDRVKASLEVTSTH